VRQSKEKAESLVVEGIKTHIVQDAMLDKLDQLTDRTEGGRARATIIGRYFSGEKRNLPGGTFWMGYGHMVMATLFVIGVDPVS
jgi:hypothetical protein